MGQSIISTFWMGNTKMGHCLRKGEAHETPWISQSTVDVDGVDGGRDRRGTTKQKKALTDVGLLKLLVSYLTCRTSAFAFLSGVARSPTSSCLCSLAHVSTVLVFFLIDKSRGPSCSSKCIMAALMSFIDALE